MRPLCCFILAIFLSTVTGLSQATGAKVLRLDSLPSDGLLLDNNWKFLAGDNPAYANSEYNDSAWETINPTLDIYDLPQIPKSGIVWFRLHLSIDSSLKNKLVLVIQQSGASQIYLDGKLIHSFGTLSADPERVKAYDPRWQPVSLPISMGSQHVLAVRYALQPHVRYTTMYTTYNHALWIQVKDLKTGIDFYQEHRARFIRYQFFLIGVWFLFCVLHFAFFLFDPSQKANFYFALYASFYVVAIVIQHIFYLETHEVAAKFLLANVSFVFFVTGNLLLLTALTRLLQQKRDIYYWGLILFAGISIFLNAGSYRWGWILGGLLAQNLIQLNIARIAILALRRKRKGAIIIVTGAACYVIIFLLFLTQGITSRDFFLTITTLDTILFNLSVLSIPIAASIYLGLEFAFVNRSLQQKLKEVSDLSEKNLAQEREKQQLLATQNETLERQVSERTSELSRSLNELKEMQTQLIQSEKMASLGELTAGIAHEIQNPLNFVNNFSEVNGELIDELKDQLAVIATQTATAGEAGSGKQGNMHSDSHRKAIEIVDNIRDNEQKINHHGKRADSIVKGMLQHSRISSGHKEPTDINALCDEYLRLAFHGQKAKDKFFNGRIETDFDSSIGKINIIPQDIGRVFLNIVNNAFYATTEKQKSGVKNYEPVVHLTTKKQNDKPGSYRVEIRVTDNGNGISEKIIDKIFQPFFTTKPTGQGTGLGLSLAYDIIKAHGGEIKVETRPSGEGSEFIILLPYIPS